MNKNIVKYLQGINFSQLTPTERTETKNLIRATDTWFSFFSVIIKQNKNLCEKM
jgi:hypothetical protein